MKEFELDEGDEFFEQGAMSEQQLTVLDTYEEHRLYLTDIEELLILEFRKRLPDNHLEEISIMFSRTPEDYVATQEVDITIVRK